MSDPAILCGSCSTPLPVDAGFCPACGTPTPTRLDDDRRSDVEATESRQRLQRALGEAYELRELIGRGGFGVVYAAWDRTLDREVAVKALRFDLFPTPTLMERFQREARAVARLRHPNIIPIYSIGEGEGLTYMTMPRIKGESLRAALRREGTFAVEEAARVATQTAEALDAAHEEGVVHRDVKPENIFLEGGDRRALLMDFGIAKAVGSEEGGLTSVGTALGTPLYMSPEQATGQDPVDHRVDIYALGCVLYEMLAGDPPFTGTNVRSIVARHLGDTPTSLTVVRPGVAPEVVAAVERALAKRPSDRFQSASELRAALEGSTGPRTPTAPAGPTMPIDRGTGAATAPMPSDAVTVSVDGAARRSLALFLLLVATAGYSLLVLAGTRDVDLLAGAAVSLPLLGARIGVVDLYVVVPLVLFAVHLSFHFHLRGVWAQVWRTAPPQVGRGPAARYPWLLLTPARASRSGSDGPDARLLHRGVRLLGWSLVPLVIYLFWARFLSVHRWGPTILHVLLLFAATALSVGSIRSAVRLYRAPGDDADGDPGAGEGPRTRALQKGRLMIGAFGTVPIFALLLPLVASWGAFHAEASLPTLGPFFRPYLSLPEPSSDGACDPSSRGTGAELEAIALRGRNLRHARMPGALLAGASLQGADLFAGGLRLADLREAHFDSARLERAVLTCAGLSGAHMDFALLSGARLEDADLSGASLRVADLRGAVIRRATAHDTVDLSGARLEGADLEGVRLPDAELLGVRLDSAARLNRAVLDRARLDGAHLRGVSLRGAHLSGAALVGADLSGAVLVDADLRSATLMDAELPGADLTGATLDGADLGFTDLAGARLNGASLLGADLEGATFDRHTRASEAEFGGAVLRGIVWAGAKLELADLPGADLRGATLDSAALMDADLRGANLSGARLRSANLTNARLRPLPPDSIPLTAPPPEGTPPDAPAAEPRCTRLDEATLTGAILRGADLRGANLRLANLEDADLRGANLEGADLSGARLAGIRGWREVASLAGARVEEVRGAPSGFAEWARTQTAAEPSAGSRCL